VSERIGVLLAGFGGLGSQDHQSAMYLPAFANRPDFELVAAVDVAGTDGAGKAAQEYSLRLHSDLDEALADPAVALVSVAAPLAARAGTISRAIRAGKHVLADKPLAATVAEGEQIARLAAERGVVVVPAHHLRLGGALRATRAAVRAGRVGLPWNVQADFLVAGGDPVPTGELVNLALYPIDVVRSLLGLEVRRVHALAGSHWHRSPQDLVTLLLDHEHGVTSTIVCGRMAGLRDVPPAGVVVHRYRISGSHGVLATDATKPAVRVHSTSRQEAAWAGPGTVDALLEVVRAGVRTGRAELGPDDALHVQRVVQAAARSLQTGRPVDVEPGSDR
jgi:predicted dehydrogenase